MPDAARARPSGAGQAVLVADTLPNRLNLTPHVEQFQQYIEALEGFGSVDPAVWQRSCRTLEQLPAGTLTAEERELAAQAAGGEGAQARRRLARQGRLYRLGLVFTGPHDPRAWEDAWREVEAMGPDAVSYLAEVILRQLLQPARQRQWLPLRRYLVRTGTAGLLLLVETIHGMTAAAARTELNPSEDLYIQFLTALLEFGPTADAHVALLATHESKNARKALARALGETRQSEWFDLLAKLHEDPEWEVRGAVLLAMERIRGVGPEAGALALRSLRTDPEPAVREIAVRTVGYLGVRDAVPDLVRLLPGAPEERAGPIMDALSRITGRRFRTRQQALQWAAERR